MIHTEVRAVCVCPIFRRATRTTITVWIVCGSGYGHYKTSILVALVVIKGRGAAVVVGDPEILPGYKGDSPGVQQVRVRSFGYASSIGNQVGLGIAGLLSPQS